MAQTMLPLLLCEVSELNVSVKRSVRLPRPGLRFHDTLLTEIVSMSFDSHIPVFFKEFDEGF